MTFQNFSLVFPTNKSPYPHTDNQCESSINYQLCPLQLCICRWHRITGCDYRLNIASGSRSPLITVLLGLYSKSGTIVMFLLPSYQPQFSPMPNSPPLVWVLAFI